MSGVLELLAGLLLLGGLLAMSVAVIGMLRLPGLALQLHAASLVGLFGTLPILLAACAAGEGALFTRALLVGVFLLLTMPVTVHVLARAAYHQSRERWPRETLED